MKRNRLGKRNISYNYSKGETFPRYGLMRKLEDGTLEFMADLGKMTWRKDIAYAWAHPPHHYLDSSSTIVNFRKDSSPVILKERKFGNFSLKNKEL